MRVISKKEFERLKRENRLDKAWAEKESVPVEDIKRLDEILYEELMKRVYSPDFWET